MPDRRKRKRDGGSVSSGGTSSASSSTSGTSSALATKAMRLRMSRSSVTTRGSRQLENMADVPSVKLDPKQCAQNLTLSPDGKTVTGFKGYRMVRATHGVREGSGAWYFEVHIERVDGGNTHGSDGRGGAHARIGWATDRANVEAPVGYGAESFALRDVDGTKVHLSLRQEFSESYSSGDVIGCYICLANSEQTRLIEEGLEKRSSSVPSSHVTTDNAAVSRNTETESTAGEEDKNAPCSVQNNNATTGMIAQGGSGDIPGAGGSDATGGNAVSQSSGGTAAEIEAPPKARMKGKGKGKNRVNGSGRKQKRDLWSEIRFYKNGKLLWGPKTIPTSEALKMIEARETGKPFVMDLKTVVAPSPKASAAAETPTTTTKGENGPISGMSAASPEQMSSSLTLTAPVGDQKEKGGGVPSWREDESIGRPVRYAFRDLKLSSSSKPSSTLSALASSLSSFVKKKSPFFPAISLYGPAEVTFNPGPLFEFPPEGLRTPEGPWLGQKEGSRGAETYHGTATTEDSVTAAAAGRAMDVEQCPNGEHGSHAPEIAVEERDVVAEVVPCRPLADVIEFYL